MKKKLPILKFIIPILILAISYCLVIYLFIVKEGLLENQIGRIAAIIDVAGIGGLAYLKKLTQKYQLATLWILALAIGIATFVQTLAVSKLHGVLARVEVIGEDSAVSALAGNRPKVFFIDSVPDFDFVSIEKGDTFVYRTNDRVLVWEQPKTVVAIDEHSGVEDRKSLEWPFESLWDIGGTQIVDLRLVLNGGGIKVVVDPPDAAIRLVAYTGTDTTGTYEMANGQSQIVNLGDKISISAKRRGYNTASDDLGFEPIRGDTTINLSLSRRRSQLKVEAYNIGGKEVEAAVVYIDGERTAYKAFDRIELEWDKAYDVMTEFVDESQNIFRSETKRVHIEPDTLMVVKSTLEYVHR